VLTARTSGTPSVAGFDALRIAVLTHPGFVSGMDVIHDHTGLSGYPSSTEVRMIAEGATRSSQAGAFWGRLAIVAPDPALYGLARMWEAYAGDGLAARTRVFVSLGEAMEWFAAPPSA
jgi:hypothetical protein